MQRFNLDKKYFTLDENVLKDSDKLKEFIDDKMSNREDMSKVHFDSAVI